MANYFIAYARPATKRASLIFDLISIGVGSCFLALMAQIAFPLWFTPVPITMQTFGLFLLAGLLGSKRAFAATLLYLAEGAMGLPVFALGQAGFLTLFGPKMGYLLSFPFSVYIVGFLLERGGRYSFVSTFLSMIVGTLFIYFFGVLCLSFYVGSFSKAIALGCIPFIPGCLLKAIAAAILIPSGWKWINSIQKIN